MGGGKESPVFCYLTQKHKKGAKSLINEVLNFRNCENAYYICISQIGRIPKFVLLTALPLPLPLPLLRPQGVRGSKIMLRVIQKDLIVTRKMQETTCSYFLARIMIFWESRFACNYIMRKTLKSWYPKIAIVYLLERTTLLKVLNTGL